MVQLILASCNSSLLEVLTPMTFPPKLVPRILFMLRSTFIFLDTHLGSRSANAMYRGTFRRPQTLPEIQAFV